MINKQLKIIRINFSSETSLSLIILLTKFVYWLQSVNLAFCKMLEGVSNGVFTPVCRQTLSKQISLRVEDQTN